MPNPDVLLATRGLSKRFGKFQAVQDLDLSVRSRDIYGFLGLNGAGKTTTLKMVLGLLRPTAGTISLFGRERSEVGPAERRELGAMVEGPAFYSRLTGVENLLRFGQLSGPFTKSAALRILEEVGLAEAANRPAGDYSLGMKQRLGIALALAPAPRLVILDEPTNGLDPQGIRDVRELIQSLNRERQLTFIVSSHLLAEIQQLCNRVGIIRRGRLVVECETAQLLAEGVRAIHVEVEPADLARRVLAGIVGADRVHQDGEEGGFLIDVSLERAAEINHALVHAGAAVRALAPRRPTLEELFLDRTVSEPAA